MSRQLLRQEVITGCAGFHPLHSFAISSTGIHQITRSFQRYRFQWTLATSLAAACVHIVNQPCSATLPQYSTSHFSLKNNSQVAYSPHRTRRDVPPSRRSAHRAFSTSTHTAEKSHIDDSSNNLDSEKKEKESVKVTESADSIEERELSEINDIGELMRHPALMKNIKKPRNPIILCHGLYGFDVRGPFWGLEIHYWASVLDILREKVGADVVVRGVPGTGAIAERAQKLHEYLISEESGVRGKSVNFVAHSMGGLDARHIISIIKPSPEEYKPVSLTTICTPHKGSPFMDWCNANVGTGNDRVQAEISKARKKMGQDNITKEELYEATRQAELEERKKLPFSLKTPLFVRPSKVGQQEGEVEEGTIREKKDKKEGNGVLDTVKATLTNVAATATSFTPTPPLSSESSSSSDTSAVAAATITPKEEETNGNKKKEKSSSSSILSLGSFNKALSSISGLFSSYMLGVLDQPAYAMLSTRYMSQVFNPSVPNSPDVAYFSIASRKRSLPIWHPLWLPKTILDAAAESRSAGGETDGSADALGGRLQGNDGLVSVESAKWGTFLGVIEGCDHWDLRGGGAPRWRGRMNPATNKPWPEEKDGIKEEEKAENKNKSWMDINTIVGKLLNRKQSKGKSDAKEKKVEEEQDQGLLNEVAGWISDRLPQGDEKRRAQADKVAAEQDRSSQRPDESEEEAVLSGSQETEDKSKQDGELASKSEEKATNFDASTTSVKLRREAAWQEQLGHNDAARELRRELDWHRTNWNRESQSSSDSNKSSQGSSSGSGSVVKSLRNLDWGERPTKDKSNGKEKKKLEDANELERFWIALCRHLWNHGY